MTRILPLIALALLASAIGGCGDGEAIAHLATSAAAAREQVVAHLDAEEIAQADKRSEACTRQLDQLERRFAGAELADGTPVADFVAGERSALAAAVASHLDQLTAFASTTGAQAKAADGLVERIADADTRAAWSSGGAARREAREAYAAEQERQQRLAEARRRAERIAEVRGGIALLLVSTPDRLEQAIAAQVERAAGGVPVLVLEGEEAALAPLAILRVEVRAAYDYVTYGSGGHGGLGLGMGTHVPERISLDYRAQSGDPSLAFSHESRIEAQQSAPEEVNQVQLSGLPRKQLEALARQIEPQLGELVQLPDADQLQAARERRQQAGSAGLAWIQVSSTVSYKSPPRTINGLRPINANDQVTHGLSSGGVAVIDGFVDQLRSRAGSALLLTPEQGAAMAPGSDPIGTIAIDGTVYVTDYGREQGAIRTVNTALPVAAQLSVAIAGAGCAAWAGHHDFKAVHDTPDQISQGAISSEARKAAEALAEQLGRQVAATLPPLD